MVPREPTDLMVWRLCAAGDLCRHCQGGKHASGINCGNYALASSDYRATIAAAPAQSAAQSAAQGGVLSFEGGGKVKVSVDQIIRSPKVQRQVKAAAALSTNAAQQATKDDK